MRDFFEDLGKRLGETAESLTNRASEVVEVQRIRGQIRALDRNNERDYRDIGRMIYEKYKNGEVIDTEMVCICEEIEKREATAEEMEQMIADSKGTTVCPNCHANLTPDMAYCPQCGEKVPEEEEEPEEEAAETEAEDTEKMCIRDRLEGSEVEVPVGATSKNAMVPMTTINTKNILFICGGAFPELDEIIRERLMKRASIGFEADLKDKYTQDKDILSKVTVEDLRKFGMIPEFLGRLPIIFTLKGLTEDMLVKILKEPKNAILKQYQKLLALDEVHLDFEEDALRAIAEKAMKKDTGARALRAIIEEFMLDIMYEIPKDDSIGQVTITRAYIEGTGGPVITLRGQQPEQLTQTF